MIFAVLDAVVAYRMHLPKWAIAPTSGAGAAIHGGRLNRIGLYALYLSLETETAIKEYQQVSRLLPPGTLVSYQITLSRVVDFRGGFNADSWPPIWNDFFCDWRELWFNQRIEPPTWKMADQAVTAGAQGVLFPSVAHPGGANVVVFPNELAEPDTVEVFDPVGALPKDQRSWHE